MLFRNGSCTALWALAATGGLLICAAPQARGQSSAGAAGLRGDYFASRDLAGPAAVTRVDSTVNFDWGSSSPTVGVPADQFSARWAGQVQAPVSGRYTFYTTSDDGVRLWVNGQLIIDNWSDHAPTLDRSPRVTLAGGKKYDIKLEYYENAGGAVARLLWEYPGRAQHVIPQAQLYPAALPAVAPPAAPNGLSATGQWVENCCGGMPMAHIDIAWQASRGATSYNVYRDGALFKQGLTTPDYQDMPVTSGQSHTYVVTAVGPGGESAKSASASATAPYPLSSSNGLIAPTNLRIRGLWQGAPTDILSWDPAPGAAHYNVYQYDTLIAAGIVNTSYVVPTNVFWNGLTYSVTAVDAFGMESLPSNIANAQGANNPLQQPGWMASAPTPPRNLTATPQWNAGKARIVLSWQGSLNEYYQHPTATFNVYRDGQKLADGLWGLNYVDNDVAPGESHTYSATGVNTPWMSTLESAPCAQVRATALTAAPGTSDTTLQINGVEGNDDSAVISFAAVPGARDYRVYDAAKPGSVKYSGGALSIEMNGLDPISGADLVVEAVDKLGPFQKMDGEMGPGAMQHDGSMQMVINGQGDPSNVPNVLARSDSFHVTCQPRTLKGEQAFLDTFRDSKPFISLVPPQAMVEANGGQVSAFENDKWAVYNVFGDLQNSKVFVMGSHFMDTFYDGGTPRTNNPMHQNYASLVMQPKATADIAGGKVLHVTFEVDAHFGGRRWCDLFVAEAGDPLINPGRFTDMKVLPTAKGNMFRWEITNWFHQAQVFWGENGQLRNTDLIDTSWGPGNERGGPAARIWWDGTPLANGTAQQLDKRHRFDLYLSRTRYRIMEEGRIIKDAAFPAGTILPFTKAAVYFVHQVYHTGLEHSELIGGAPEETYWINHRPWADERHWDNMGFEVLQEFPL